MHTDKIAIQESAEAYFFLILHMDEITGSPQLMTITQKIKHVLLLHQKEHGTSSIVIVTIIRYVLLLLCFLCQTANTLGHDLKINTLELKTKL